MIRGNPPPILGHSEARQWVQVSRPATRSLYGLRRYPPCRQSSLSKVCPAYATSTPHAGLCKTRVPSSKPHRAHSRHSGENDARQPTRHAIGFIRRNSNLWQLFRPTGFRHPHQHARPSVYTDNDRKLPSVRVKSRSDLLASGSHRGDINVEERMEGHDRVDGYLCVLLLVPLLPADSFS